MPIDMSAVKAPPRKRQSAAPIVPQKSTRNMREEGLMGIGQLAQGGLLIAQQYADAAAIGNHWGPIATEVAKLADSFDGVARVVDGLIQAGPFAGLITAVLPLAMQLAANHRLIDAGKTLGSNVVAPEILEAQMKADIMRAQAEAMRQQQQAMREAQAAQAEIERLLAEANQPEMANA